MVVKARLLGARIVVVDSSYRDAPRSSKIAGTWRGSLLAVRDITWCLWRLRLVGVRHRRQPAAASRGGRARLAPASRAAGRAPTK